MITDVTSAGFYESIAGKKFPRVQLLTIEGLLSGKQRAGLCRRPPTDHPPDLNFKKAKAEANAAQKELIQFMNKTAKSLSCALAFGAMTLLAHGDVLTGTNGGRFVGTVMVETATNVVFQSELGGQLTFPQSKIRELQRTPPVELTNTAITFVATNNPVITITNCKAVSPSIDAHPEACRIIFICF